MRAGSQRNSDSIRDAIRAGKVNQMKPTYAAMVILAAVALLAVIAVTGRPAAT